MAICKDCIRKEISRFNDELENRTVAINESDVKLTFPVSADKLLARTLLTYDTTYSVLDRDAGYYYCCSLVKSNWARGIQRDWYVGNECAARIICCFCCLFHAAMR